MFEEIKNELSDQLGKLNDEEINILLTEFSGLPNDYLVFLKEVGYGNLGEIQIYSGPIPPNEVYPVNKELEGIILFGDDHQGYCFGFDSRDSFRVVEVDPKGSPDKSIESDFSSLIREYFD